MTFSSLPSLPLLWSQPESCHDQKLCYLWHFYCVYLTFVLSPHCFLSYHPTCSDAFTTTILPFLHNFLAVLGLSLVQSVQSLSCVQLFATPWITASQASLSITNSRSLPKPMLIESVMPSGHLILCVPFSSCPQSLPASGSSAVSQFFSRGGQSTGVLASASVLPMNIQDCSPLGWTGWISLQSKGLSRVFSNTIAPNYQFFSDIHKRLLKKPQPWLDESLLAK